MIYKKIYLNRIKNYSESNKLLVIFFKKSPLRKYVCGIPDSFLSNPDN